LEVDVVVFGVCGQIATPTDNKCRRSVKQQIRSRKSGCSGSGLQLDRETDRQQMPKASKAINPPVEQVRSGNNNQQQQQKQQPQQRQQQQQTTTTTTTATKTTTSEVVKSQIRPTTNAEGQNSNKSVVDECGWM
jgi:hypothetical protein